MPRSSFDQSTPQRASASTRAPSTREAAQRSVERVTTELEKVFAKAKGTGR